MIADLRAGSMLLISGPIEPVRLRPAPDANTIAKLPVGSIVTSLGETDRFLVKVLCTVSCVSIHVIYVILDGCS